MEKNIFLNPKQFLCQRVKLLDNMLKNDTVTGTGFPLLVRGENRFILGGGITDGSVFSRWCSL